MLHRKSIKALIIDDEDDICLLLSSFLKKQSLEVCISNNLKDGLRITEEFQPDILFLDNNLPDGSGIDAIDEFRKLNSDMKIIVISALTTLQQKAMDNSADGFLGKPISFASIYSLL
jgi:two-component system, OmpR family, response regulator